MADATTPSEYLRQLDEPRRSEVRLLHDLVRKNAPGLKPYMQDGMIGYGKYHYRYASGREGDSSVIGLASRKQYISLYVSAACEEGQYVAEKHRRNLPKADIGKSCIRIKKLEDVDMGALAAVVREGAEAGGLSAVTDVGARTGKSAPKKAANKTAAKKR